MILVSGFFDPLHDGHLDYLEGAREYGEVVVALNSDQCAIRKKGYVFMPWEVRARVLRALSIVHDVISFDDSDGTVCEALRRIKPDYFANGGDRTTPDEREHKVCQELGITELFGVGGDKINSSSELVERIRPSL